MPKRIIFVDVDDTLVRSVGTRRIPMPGVLAEIRELFKNGAELYLWSSGGAEYSEAAAKELGIRECFVAFLPKPNSYIDDQPVHEWRFCKHVLPSNAREA
jgi:Predicted hydrolases of the HAD superfamily